MTIVIMDVKYYETIGYAIHAPRLRRAQFLLDFIEAENSMGFHAPQEAARVLGLSIDNSRKGQLALRK